VPLPSQRPRDSTGSRWARLSIWDSGAAGGLVVSPLDLQAGAKLVAAYEGIIEIQMAPVSTTTDYMVKFLDHILPDVRQI